MKMILKYKGLINSIKGVVEEKIEGEIDQKQNNWNTSDPN